MGVFLKKVWEYFCKLCVGVRVVLSLRLIVRGAEEEGIRLGMYVFIELFIDEYARRDRKKVQACVCMYVYMYVHIYLTCKGGKRSTYSPCDTCMYAVMYVCMSSCMYVYMYSLLCPEPALSVTCPYQYIHTHMLRVHQETNKHMAYTYVIRTINIHIQTCQLKDSVHRPPVTVTSCHTRM